MSPTHTKAPSLIVLDVNETLSDMSPLAEKFETVGLPPHEREAWFAGLLRDGFSLTSVGENPDFAQLAAKSLRLRLRGRCPEEDLDRRRFESDQLHRETDSGLGKHADGWVANSPESLDCALTQRLQVQILPRRHRWSAPDSDAEWRILKRHPDSQLWTKSSGGICWVVDGWD